MFTSTRCANFLIAALAFVATTTATGQQTLDESLSSQDAWYGSVRITAGAWFPRLGGDSSLATLPGAMDIDVEDDIELNDSETVFNGELTLRAGQQWEINAGGFDFDTDASGMYAGPATTFGTAALAPGDPYSSTFDFTSLFADVAVWMWDVSDPNTRSDSLTIAPIVGVRYIDLKHSLTAPVSGMPKQTGDGDWMGVYGGVTIAFHSDFDGALPFTESVDIFASTGVGPAFGGDGGSMWHIRAGAGLNFTPNIGIEFGYRLVEMDVEDDDFEFDGGLQGLFLAARITF